MSVSGLAERRLRSEFDVTDEQLRALRSISESYEARGLIGTEDSLPLYEACTCGEECWRGVNDQQPEAANAGVSLPWVGEQFHEARVVIIGINLRGYGGLMANWEIKTGRNLGTSGELGALAQGHLKVNNSMFAFAMGSYAAAVVGSLDGHLPSTEELPTPQHAGAALASCAFLQAVKCSPDSAQSRPTQAMCENCPREFLVEELRMLGPSALIVLGDVPLARLRALVRSTDWTQLDELKRGMMDLGEGPVHVLGCRHPAAPGQRWRAAYASLVRSLAEKPLH